MLAARAKLQNKFIVLHLDCQHSETGTQPTYEGQIATLEREQTLLTVTGQQVRSGRPALRAKANSIYRSSSQKADYG
jgi:hypothetical protein